MKKNILILLLAFVCNFSFGQTNYFVSTMGNNANSGTSIATPWATIQKAANSVTPNSIVNILAGNYNELITINTSGTIGNPITFKNYQNDIVTISGAGFSASYNNIIAINSKSNLVFDGLILENLTCAFARGILVLSNPSNGINNIVFRNLKIRNIGFTTNVASIPTSIDNAHGIEVYGQGTSTTDAISNITIENCEVYNNVLGYSEAVTLNGNVDGFLIKNNTIHDNTNIGIDVAGNFSASATASLNHARNGIISGNTTYNNVSPNAVSSGIYCDGCCNTIIERNNSYNNPVGITAGCEQNGTTENVIIRNNIVHNNTYTGINFGGYNPSTTGIVTNSKVYNNTCFFNDNANLKGQMVVLKTNNCEIFQNIFYSNGNLLFYVDNILPQNFTLDYNDYYTNAGDISLAQVNYQFNTVSYSTYKTNTGFDTNSVFGNPTFVNSSATFDIQGISPCVNAGNPSFVIFNSETDFSGNPRISNTVADIGANEYQFPLSVDENALVGIKIYPNPAEKFITIDTKLQVDTYEIFNTKAQIVSKGLNNNTIDISKLNAGLYFVNFQIEGNIYIRKIIKK